MKLNYIARVMIVAVLLLGLPTTAQASAGQPKTASSDIIPFCIPLAQKPRFKMIGSHHYVVAHGGIACDDHVYNYKVELTILSQKNGEIEWKKLGATKIRWKSDAACGGAGSLCLFLIHREQLKACARYRLATVIFWKHHYRSDWKTGHLLSGWTPYVQPT